MISLLYAALPALERLLPLGFLRNAFNQWPVRVELREGCACVHLAGTDRRGLPSAPEKVGLRRVLDGCDRFYILVNVFFE